MTSNLDEVAEPPVSAAQLHFDRGTLVFPDLSETNRRLLAPWVQPDPRNNSYRAPAYHYAAIALSLHRAGVPWIDHAKSFLRLALEQPAITPYPYQQQALDAWWKAQRRGVLELPTGAGKTIVAALAIARTERPTLIVVPTLELMAQWATLIARFFPGLPIGRLGGGVSDVQVVTIATYDSAALQIEFNGHRFGLLICDECHHLPAPAYRFIAEAAIAPFRLGLTATFARADGQEVVAERLLGPVVFRVNINELEGRYLAPYHLKTLRVPLTPDETEDYRAARHEYVSFVREKNINLSGPQGWTEFIRVAHRSEHGRTAFQAYRRQKAIALRSHNKLAALWEILCQHRDDRILIFTEDNETVYKLSQTLLIPALTHHTPPAERRAVLEGFSSGKFSRLLTSKVLNEGVDVPEANVAIVFSGSGSVREHVQRLGRILRQRPNKQAWLYELLTDVPTESAMSERRRQHVAYTRKSSC